LALGSSAAPREYLTSQTLHMPPKNLLRQSPLPRPSGQSPVSPALVRKNKYKNLSEQKANKRRTFCRGNLRRMAREHMLKVVQASILHIRLSTIFPRICLRSRRSLISRA
jgi:hypothetical protein